MEDARDIRGWKVIEEGRVRLKAEKVVRREIKREGERREREREREEERIC